MVNGYLEIKGVRDKTPFGKKQQEHLYHCVQNIVFYVFWVIALF